MTDAGGAAPTVEGLLRRATETLAAAGIDGARADARRLLAHALGVDAGRLLLIARDPMPRQAADRFADLVAARARRAPVSHLIGRRAFWGRDFIVTPDVLDPRPETEVLIAAALDLPFDTLLDLGSGTGCILLTLLAECPAARGTGTDLSEAALAVAAANRAALGLADRATLIAADWWEGVEGRFDLVVSNPPYIAQAEMADLAPEVRDHEPHLALTDRADGLGAYRAILAGAAAHMEPDGHLLLEIGPTQAAAVAAIAADHGLAVRRILPDLDGRDRVVFLTRPSA